MRGKIIGAIKRGDIFYADLKNGIGSQQRGRRPVIVYSNNSNNNHSTTINVIPLSKELKELCVHVLIRGGGLKEPSMALLEQITTIDKVQLIKRIGVIDDYQMIKIDEAADIQFGRIPAPKKKNLLKVV